MTSTNMVFNTAEIGVNWNGDFDLAEKLMIGAKTTGCNAVKFQAFDDKIVNIDDIIHLIEKAKRKFKNRYQRIFIIRILVVAKNYDGIFLERTSLEKIMTQTIKSKLKIDLIVKEDVGYSVLWISPYV